MYKRKRTFTHWVVAIMILSVGTQQAQAKKKKAYFDVQPLESMPGAKEAFSKAKMGVVKKCEKNACLMETRIIFVTHSEGEARDGTGMMAKRHDFTRKRALRLEGISDDVYQRITDTANDYYEQKLAEAGFNVKSYDWLTQQPKFDKLPLDKDPVGETYELGGIFADAQTATGARAGKKFVAHNRPDYKKLIGNAKTIGFSMKADPVTIAHTTFVLDWLQIASEGTFSVGYTEYKFEWSISALPKLYPNDIKAEFISKAYLSTYTPRLGRGSNPAWGVDLSDAILSVEDDPSPRLKGSKIKYDKHLVYTVDPQKYEEAAVRVLKQYIDTIVAGLAAEF